MDTIELSTLLFELFVTTYYTGMKNFRILPEGYTEPQPEPHYYSIGTHLIFLKDQFVESMTQSLTVSFA